MKETYTGSAIRHLATTADGDIIAAALFVRTVSLWNLLTGTRVSEFDTVLDFGGKRLALSQTESACLSAAYKIHGLACHETPFGRLRWQRRDLKKVQQILVTPDGCSVYCCRDEGPCEVVSISTGETTNRIRGLRYVWIDARDIVQLRKTSDGAVVCRDQGVAFRIVLNSFAILDAVISESHVTISEAGGDVRIFSLTTGKEVLRHTQPEGYHILSLSLSPDASGFYGVQWKYDTGGQKLLLRFSFDSPESEVVRDLGKPSETVFCHRGRHLLTSEGDLVDCQSGDIATRLAFPMMEYSRG